MTKNPETTDGKEPEEKEIEGELGPIKTKNYFDTRMSDLAGPNTAADGGLRRFQIDGIIAESELLNRVAEALDIKVNAHLPELQELVERLATWTQTDRADINIGLAKKLLRFTKTFNGDGAKISALREKLRDMYRENKIKFN